MHKNSPILMYHGCYSCIRGSSLDPSEEICNFWFVTHYGGIYTVIVHCFNQSLILLHTPGPFTYSLYVLSCNMYAGLSNSSEGMCVGHLHLITSDMIMNVAAYTCMHHGNTLLEPYIPDYAIAHTHYVNPIELAASHLT